MANNDDEKEDKTPYWKRLRTVGTSSVSGPSGPSKAAPSVEYSSNELGKTKTIYDGTSPTQYNAETDPVLGALRKAPGMGTAMQAEKAHYPPCINPSCKSYGHSHPNCRCYSGPGGSSQEAGMFAQGGEVHYCLSCKPHHESCEHFASGGEIADNMELHNDPQSSIGHVAMNQGLLGLLTKVGHSKSEDSNRHFDDYVKSFKHGHKALHHHMEHLFTSQSIEPDKHAREALKSHLQMLREKPEALLDVGGNLGSVLPMHGASLGALAGTALNHFNAIRPMGSQGRPLDEISPPNKQADETYDRHLDIANNPAMIIQHTKDGMLLPSDVMALKNLYPSLHKNMVDKAGEALITAKSQNMEIPYKTKQSLSMLLGEPMDSTMTPQSMQAIIKSAGPQQAQQQAKKTPKKASAVELKQIDKSISNDSTTLQARQMEKKS